LLAVIAVPNSPEARHRHAGVTKSDPLQVLVRDASRDLRRHAFEAQSLRDLRSQDAEVVGEREDPVRPVHGERGSRLIGRHARDIDDGPRRRSSRAIDTASGSPPSTTQMTRRSSPPPRAAPLPKTTAPGT